MATINWWAWITSPVVSESTRSARKYLVELWTAANDETDPQVVIDKIVSGDISAEDTGLRLLGVVSHMAPGTIAQWITMLGGKGKPKKGSGFLLSVLGKDKFDVAEFAGLVPTGDATTLTSKKAPTVEELRHILRSLANPRDRALIGLLAISGMR